MNKRVLFFSIAAAACLLLSPVAEPEFRWLPFTLAGVYGVLALLVALDALGRRQRR